MDFRKGELSKLVLRSLTNMREAKTRFLPLSINLPNAAALAIQIKARDEFLCNIRRIRISLGRRIVHQSSASRRAPTARKSHSKHRTRRAGTGSSGATGRNAS
jgi:hypothetical protein